MSVYIPFELWEKILEKLHQKYTIVCIDDNKHEFVANAYTKEELVVKMLDSIQTHLYYPDDDPHGTEREYLIYTYQKDDDTNEYKIVESDQKMEDRISECSGYVMDDLYYICSCHGKDILDYCFHPQKYLVSEEDAINHFLETGHYETWFSTHYIFEN